MSKKRRTKREKLVASERREIKLTDEGNYSFVPSENLSTKITGSPRHIKQSNSYSHVIKDSQKTLFVTILLILLNVLFFILLKNQIVKIPFLGF